MLRGRPSSPSARVPKTHYCRAHARQSPCTTRCVSRSTHQKSKSDCWGGSSSGWYAPSAAADEPPDERRRAADTALDLICCCIQAGGVLRDTLRTRFTRLRAVTWVAWLVGGSWGCYLLVDGALSWSEETCRCPSSSIVRSQNWRRRLQVPASLLSLPPAPITSPQPPLDVSPHATDLRTSSGLEPPRSEPLPSYYTCSYHRDSTTRSEDLCCRPSLVSLCPFAWLWRRVRRERGACRIGDG